MYKYYYYYVNINSWCFLFVLVIKNCKLYVDQLIVTLNKIYLCSFLVFQRKSLLYNTTGNTILRDIWDYEKMYIIFSGAFVVNVQFISFDDSPREKTYNFGYQVVWPGVIHYTTKIYSLICNILTNISYYSVIVFG